MAKDTQQLHFSSPSAVTHIDILPQEKEQIPQAVIYVPATLSTHARNLPRTLIDHGLLVHPTLIDGQPGLHVAGFKTSEQLLHVLRQHGYIQGEPSVETKRDQTPKSLWGRVRENSLMLSGAFYMLGDISILLSGLLRGDKDEIRTGLGFGFGDTILLAYGKKNQAQQYFDITDNLSKLLRRDGVNIPSHSSFSATAQSLRKHTGNDVSRFLRDQSFLIKAISEITAGFSFYRAGINQNNAGKASAGIAMMSAFGSALVIPEKTSTELGEAEGTIGPDGAPRQSPHTLPLLKKLSLRIQKSPLAIPGLFAVTNNILTLLGAEDERKHWRKREKVQALLGDRQALDAMEDQALSLKTDGTYTERSVFTGKVRTVDTESAELKLKKIRHTIQSEQWGENDPIRVAEYTHTGETLLHERNALAEELKTVEHGSGWMAKRFGALTGEKLPGKAFWIFNVSQSVFMLIANALLMISSKTSGNSAKESPMLNALYNDTAALILAQPKERREGVASRVAHFLAARPEIDVPEATLKRTILERAGQLQHNPWYGAYQQAELATKRVPEQTTAPHQATPETSTKEADTQRIQEDARTTDVPDPNSAITHVTPAGATAQLPAPAL